MKILILNTSDLRGGAARAAYRLHSAFLENKIDSIMLVLNKYSNDSSVKQINLSIYDKIYMRILRVIEKYLLAKYNPKTIFTTDLIEPWSVLNEIRKIDPDIIHIHWIYGGIINLKSLQKLECPIVWTLHDNRPFTGGCHMKYQCERYRDKCGNCPILGSNKIDDLSRMIWKRSMKKLRRIDLVVNGLSKWIMNMSMHSSLLGDKKHVNLPNLINTNIYKQCDKGSAKNVLNIAHDKRIILFGAMRAIHDERKGYRELIKALSNIQRDDVIVLIFGSREPSILPELRFEIRYLGTLLDEISLITLYSASDVMVVPSLQENLSNTIMESLSCGLPVVAFNIGGNSDMITHKYNGYLAKPFQSDDLAYGIEWILNNEEYNQLSRNARQTILTRYDSQFVVKQYVAFYQNLLNR